MYKETETEQKTKIDPRYWWAALLFHILFPGLGQFYNGRIKRAVYLFIGFQLVFWFWSIVIYHTESFSSFVMMWIMATLVWIYGLIDAILLSLKIKGSYKPNKYNDKWHKYAIVIMLMFLVSELSEQFIEAKIIEAYRMPASSMEDAIFNGDYLIAKKCSNQDIKIRDIIVFKYPRDPSINYLKRIVASEGQKIEIKDKVLYVNGTQFEEPSSIKHTDPRIFPEGAYSIRDNLLPTKIPENKYFVMGDNRDNSADSRFWGFLDKDLVLGKALFIHWSMGPEPESEDSSSAIRWDRIGKNVN